MQLLTHHKLPYTNIVFSAIAEQEPLQDVHTITLKGEYAKNIERIAVNNLTASRKKLTNKIVMAEMDRLFDIKPITVQESVTRNHNGLFAVVNADRIDELAVNRAFELVVEAIDQLEGYGTVYFGPVVSFSKHELSWLNIH